MSYLFYTHYLQTYIMPPGAAGDSGKAVHTRGAESDADDKAKRYTDDCERRIDEELAASMPASDPPSWTLGGSTISKRRHN